MATRRILFVQYAGDYREAFQRLRQGGAENYRGQQYTVEAVEQIGQRFGQVGVLIYQTAEKYDTVLPSGTEVIGLGYQDHPESFDKIVRRIRDWKPTHLVQRCISPEVLQWAVRAKIRTLLLTAESRPTSGFRNWWRNRRIARTLSHPGIEWCGNHQVNAARWLAKIGVSADKIIPWDYEYQSRPEDYTPKKLEQKEFWTIGFVGPITEGKGVPEILAAVEWLKRQQLPVRARLAGRGDIEALKAEAARLGIEDRVEFLELVSNVEALGVMREADVVVVPSRHEYTEAFPLTILESFLSRTPLIVSDHPMFRDKVEPGTTGLMFPAKNGAALGECVKQLLGDAPMYERISANSAAAWHAMTIPVQWAEMLHRWLEDTPESRDWLFQHRLASGRYS